LGSQLERQLKTGSAAVIRWQQRVMMRAAALLLTTFVAAQAGWANSSGTGLPDLLHPGSPGAPGFGSDAFRSPLDDTAGWWSDLAPEGASWVRGEIDASVPISRGLTRDHGALFGSEWSWTAARESRFLRRFWLAAARFTNPRWEGTWTSSSSGLGMRSVSTRFDLGLRVVDIVPGFTAQFAVPVWRSRDDVRGGKSRAGLRYRAGSRFVVQGHWGRGELPDRLQTDVKGEPWSASMNVVTEERRADARVQLPWRWALEGATSRNDFSEGAPRDAALEYHITPAGHVEMQQAGVVWNRVGRRQLLGRWTRAELDTRGALSWGGQRFGELNYARARLQSWLAAARVSLAGGAEGLFELESVTASGEARGVLETWPFTATVIDLLGQRWIARGRFAAEWQRVQASVDVPLGSRTRVRGGLAWYDARPEASLDSWRPTFLVFGRSEERLDVLRLYRVQLVALSAGTELRFGCTRMTLGVQQFVPLRVFEGTGRGAGDGLGGAAPGGSGAGSGQGKSSHDGFWPGGTSFELSLLRLF